MSQASGIRWREWGREAFEEAKRGDKPILLRLSAVWCHWCHVMDNTSDRESRAQQILNERYVPIRVDIDRMPDVRERYNFGGYPTSAFLTPDGKILTGGTYIPPEQFVELLDSVERAYHGRKPEILEQIARHEAEHKPRPAPPPASPEAVAEDLYDGATASVLALFDGEHGGFGSQPKFPQGAAAELAVLAHLESGRREYETVARRSLDAMRASELWDREELGFFRYCVRPDWSEPHYEKMLETNGALLRAYALAGRTWRREEDLRTIGAVRGYLERTLRDPATGLFYGSQDADEEYYGLPLTQRRSRTAPYVDRTHYADWNAQLVSAYCAAYLATGEASWLVEARRTIDALLAAAYHEGEGLLHFVREGSAQRAGLFSDQAYGARALLDVFELTLDESYLQRAERLVEGARGAMWDASRGRFNDKAAQADDLGLLAHAQSSVVENGVMAQAFARLGHHRPEAGYGKMLDELLQGHAGAAETYGIFVSELAIAALMRRQSPLEVHVTGPLADVGAAVRETARIRHPNVVLLRSERGDPAATRRGVDLPPGASVFFCAGQACSRAYRADEPFADDAARLLASVKGN